MKKLILTLIALTSLIGTECYAQEAPPPHKMPRLPVHRLVLGDKKDSVLQSRHIEGVATILDAERLKINGLEVRLFGIVPPQLSASFGPQARATLDGLVAGKIVSCSIRDRDHEGRLLANCQTTGNSDLALELIKRGLAVAARGSLADTELAPSYFSAEQEASQTRVGLWSVVMPSPVLIPNGIHQDLNTAQNDQTKTENKDTNASYVGNVINKIARKEPAPTSISQATTPAQKELLTNSGDSIWNNFIEKVLRYQVLIGSLFTLITAFTILITLNYNRSTDRRNELKSIAAALRGELMAARTVCQSRAKEIHNADEDKNAVWPRIRSTLYRAHVSRIGWLGAELARQVASIYGQANDYANYYEGLDPNQSPTTPKRVALETLTRHIESVLPRLAQLEEKGNFSFKNTNTPATFTNLQEPTTTQDEPLDNSNDYSEYEIEDEFSIANDDHPIEEVSEVALPQHPSPVHAYSPIPLWKAMSNFTRHKMTQSIYESDKDQVGSYLLGLEDESLEIATEESSTDAAESAIIRIAKLGSGRS